MSRNFTHNSNFIFYTNLFGEETQYNIQEIILPGISFSHTQTSTNSTFLNLQGDTLNYNDLTLYFIMDEDLLVWKEIVKSLQSMRDPLTGTGNPLEKYSYLEIHDDNSKMVLKLEFINCMIEGIDDLTYSTTTQDDIITCSVTIKYDYYTIIDEGES